MAKKEAASTSEIEKMKVYAGFKNRVMLPSIYYEKLKQEKLKWAILKTPKGEWEVKVRLDENGDIFFEDGWPRFVHENAFNDHDFLELEHVCNKLHFNVNVASAVSAPTAPPQNQGSQPKSSKGKAKKKADVFPHNQWSSFTKKMTSYFVKKSAMMPIPGKFVESNNFTTKKNITLMDPQERKWEVTLRIQHEVRIRSESPNSAIPNFGMRMFMTKGWHDFCVANELKEGDVCKFVLNPESPSTSTSLLHVQINP